MSDNTPRPEPSSRSPTSTSQQQQQQHAPPPPSPSYVSLSSSDVYDLKPINFRLSSIPLKRKEPPSPIEHDQKQPPFSPGPAAGGLPPGATATIADTTHQGEYEKGRITCEICGTAVTFRDEATGGFTLKHWEAHRLTCSSASGQQQGQQQQQQQQQGRPPNEPVIYTPESTAEALAHPPAKRRRAKRTEEERIDYLRADPYVAQFEAYRVLCASCDKWIRLRPNSTYCSIPWDAHRKSCLAKKVNSKNVYALEERTALFSKDPDIRKFDAERVLCNICDKWMSVNPDEHLQAVQKWLQHRAACQKSAVAPSVIPLPPPPPPPPPPSRPPLPVDPVPCPSPAEQKIAALGPSGTTRSASISPKPGPSFPPDPPPPAQSGSSSHSHTQSGSIDVASSFHDFNPSNFAPTHESRRRNAEQRAATLRADTLIREVEPNRVFCSLCQKWVQLRQDSSYCAYPWLQHRGKCLARHQRRVQKAAETAGNRRQHLQDEEDELMSENDGGVGGVSDGPESEDGIDSHAEEERLFLRRKEQSRRVEQRHHLRDLQQQQQQQQRGNGRVRARSAYHYPHHLNRHSLGAMPPAFQRHDIRSGGGPSSSYPPPRPTSSGRHWDDDGEVDGPGPIDVDTYMVDEDRTLSRVGPRAAPPVRRPWPVGLADLDSPAGRRDFVLASIDYLFRTTYETTDDMSISALLVYLNAAMPQDKHEDFDTAEVTKTAALLHDKGRIIFEGDLIRLPD